MRKISFYLVILVVLLLGILIGRVLFQVEDVQEDILSSDFGSGKIVVLAPALDNDGGGVVVEIETEVREGSGSVLVNINNVLADYYMQESARLAARAAANYSAVNLSDFDVYFSVRGNASIIGGPSAGGSMAISAIALLEGKELRDDVMMTGAVLESGEITRVGGILEKAKAAKEANASIFLVAEGLSYEVVRYERVKSCDDDGRYCRVDYKAIKRGIGDEIGVEFIEVGNIKDVAEVYFK